MKIKKTSSLDPRENLEKDCLDVLVTFENDVFYMIEITTPKFFYIFMKRFKNDFVPPSYPYIIVSKLTDEIIRACYTKIY